MRKLFLLNLLALVFACLTNTRALAWNALGHQLIAQIAYNQLSSDKQSLLNRYNQAIDDSSFVDSATWMDRQFSPDYRWLKPLHYIDIPYTTDGTAVEKESENNAVSAITEALAILKDENASLDKKALYLRILIHVVGDIHQPMHAISRFSRRFPNGDKGGNLFKLNNNPVASNLHAYWDKGGGFLVPNKKNKKRISKKKDPYAYAYTAVFKRKTLDKTIQTGAYAIEEMYPCQAGGSIELDPNKWAEESWNIAVNQAYKIRYHQKPKRPYQKMVKQVSKQRIALAGCRLAVLLNSI
jgi:hypothetical protein